MATRTGTAASLDWRTIAIRGGLAVALSLLANWLLLGAVLAGDLAPPFEHLSLPPVTLFTTLGALGATAVYWGLQRVSERPDRAFVVVAAVALVASFVPDLSLLRDDPAATVPAVAALMAMHVLTAAICVAVLTGAAPLALARR